MARIPMTSGFVIIPEGEYVFRIYDATYDEDFGRIEIKLVNAQGATHTERFSIRRFISRFERLTDSQGKHPQRQRWERSRSTIIDI